jgi:hypothetical protein
MGQRPGHHLGLVIAMPGHRLGLVIAMPGHRLGLVIGPDVRYPAAFGLDVRRLTVYAATGTIPVR